MCESLAIRTDTLSAALAVSSAVPPTETELSTLRTIADYQFGAGSGAALFPDESALTVRRATSGRPRQVLTDSGRLVTLTGDGRFTLGFAGGRRLHADRDPIPYWVAVGDESEPFVRDGDNAFAKFVRDVDPAIRPGDAVLVTHIDSDELLGVGRASLSASAMLDFDRGQAVAVREGRDEWAA